MSLLDLPTSTLLLLMENISTPVTMGKEEEELLLTNILVGFLPAATDVNPELINCLKRGNESDKIIVSFNYFFLVPPMISKYLASHKKLLKIHIQNMKLYLMLLIMLYE